MTIFRLLVQFGLMMFVATVCAAAEPDGYQLVERAQDGATYQRVIQHTNDAGEVTTQTNQLSIVRGSTGR